MGAGASFAHDLSLEFRFGRKQSFVSSVAGAQVGEAGRSIGNTGGCKTLGGRNSGMGRGAHPPPPAQKGTGDVDGQWRRAGRKGGRGGEQDNIKITSSGGGGLFQAQPSNGLTPRSQTSPLPRPVWLDQTVPSLQVAITIGLATKPPHTPPL